MLSQRIKKDFEKNKDTYVALMISGAVVAYFSYKIGARDQKNMIVKGLKDATILRKSVNPMFPQDMPISEIKNILSNFRGAEVMDALVVTIDNVQRIIVR